MSVIHFEIHAADVQRALAFYQAAFDWTVEDWSEYAGSPYFGVTTKQGEDPGINGAIMQRRSENPPSGARVMGAVLTIGTDDYEASAARILQAGGTVAQPKVALPGMPWQGYFLDTEGNVFGLHQPDPQAK